MNLSQEMAVMKGDIVNLSQEIATMSNDMSFMKYDGGYNKNEFK